MSKVKSRPTSSVSRAILFSLNFSCGCFYFLMYNVLKPAHIDFSCLQEFCKCCFAVKLQKCFCGSMNCFENAQIFILCIYRKLKLLPMPKGDGVKNE